MNVVYLDEVGSTNDVALQLARDGAPEETVVVAGRQLKGRGRRGREWWDEPGASAMLSIVVYPNTPLAEVGQLAFVASLGAAECLSESCGLNVSLKWPNDVLMRDKKLGGILVETSPVSGRTAAIIGIGVNVNQRAFPPDLADTATSIALEYGTSLDPTQLSESLALRVLDNYSQLLRDGFKEILTRWRKYMWGAGLRVEIQSESGPVEGIIAGVDETGALLVRVTDGTTRAIHAADTIKTRAS